MVEVRTQEPIPAYPETICGANKILHDFLQLREQATTHTMWSTLAVTGHALGECMGARLTLHPHVCIDRVFHPAWKVENPLHVFVIGFPHLEVSHDGRHQLHSLSIGWPGLRSQSDIQLHLALLSKAHVDQAVLHLRDVGCLHVASMQGGRTAQQSDDSHSIWNRQKQHT